MPVCVTGMHRSGTSMVARILHECGVYLGPLDDLLPPGKDNFEGFWENTRFVELNDDLLTALGGAWDMPPRDGPDGSVPDDVRRRAEELVAELAAREPWGWKDPRNSLTLPFWQRLLPDLKVVVCLRHPVEVARSLATRGSSSERFGFDLWLTYNRRLLEATPPQRRLVTHYDAYFHDPEREGRRLLDFVGVPVDEQDLARAAAGVNETVRHHGAAARKRLDDLPPDVARCYDELCAEAGPVFERLAAEQ